ncbi:MAG TPA: DUF2268 domain-containing putative Zn-dependent protease [Rhizomicrobium sp.]
MRLVWMIAVATMLCVGPACATPDVHIEDVTLFYQVYDVAGGHPTADQIQHDYIDKGSDGLRRFFEERRTTAARVVQSIADHPQVYVDARKCLAVLPRAKDRISAALTKLGTLYSDAKFPPVTVAIGRGKPVAIADETGVMIGLESLCGVTWMSPDLEDRVTYVVAHEYTHVQQALASPAFYNIDKPTVLDAALIEGAAEFMGILTSGGTSYAYFAKATQGKEKEIETAFVPDEDKTDLSAWFFNGTLEKPGDMGYWVGRRIVQSYYEHATDKRQAIRDIIEIKDAHAFLAKSGWYPGISLKGE